MKRYQVLSASTTLSCRVGLIFCVLQGDRGKTSKSEEKARQTRGKREVSELRVRVASIRIALFKLFCTCTQLGLCARIVFAPVLQNIRQKLLVFGKLVVSTATAHFEIATKFDTVVKLAGFQ